MTDFFTRLAEQTLGRAPVVEPLVAPRFAPEAISPELTAAWTADEELTRQALPPPSIQPHQAEPPTVEAGPVVPPPTLVPTPPAGAYAPAHAELPTEKGRPAAGLADEPIQAGEPVSGAVPEKGRAAEKPRSARAHPTIERTPVAAQRPIPKRTGQAAARTERPSVLLVDAPSLVAPEPPSPQAAYPPSAEPPPSTPKAETEQKTPPIQHAIEVETRIMPPAKIPPPSQPSVTRQARRPVAMAAGEQPAAESSHQTPAIRVTIGRVEVRAVQPPEPPRPRARTAVRMPTLSLDDYLQRRNGGEP
jgi:hypothetical protein